MQFTGGDWVALSAVGLSVAGFAVREWRTTVTAKTKQASDDSTLHHVVDELTAKLDTALGLIGELEGKRQRHELDCARINERTAASQERTAEILKEHTGAIASLQSQIRNVATGATGKIIEYPPPDQKPRAK
jgi:hypothetical protein